MECNLCITVIATTKEKNKAILSLKWYCMHCYVGSV